MLCFRVVYLFFIFFFFFFKQKTAYELRISDWSSDVCSSDLHHRAGPRRGPVRPGAYGRYPAARHDADDRTAPARQGRHHRLAVVVRHAWFPQGASGNGPGRSRIMTTEFRPLAVTGIGEAVRF